VLALASAAGEGRETPMSKRNDGRADFEIIPLSRDGFGVVVDWIPDETATIVSFDTEAEAMAWIAANAPKH
jgi:hypothetical protein